MSRWKQKDPHVQAATPEKLRIEIDNVFRTFMDDPEIQHYDFSADLNNLQRKYIHEKAKKLNLQSKSHGKEPNRILTIYKRKKLVNYESFFLHLSDAASNAVNKTLAHSASVDKSDSKRKLRKYGESDLNFGRIQYLKPVTVKPATANPLLDFRKTLPVHDMRSNIIKLINDNRVIIISSETGSGKTTQIPQFILEESSEKGTKCRVVCTQPRRISAVAVAERVAAERGEQVGGTVGYSIRLESKMGPLTALYYCTNGILLRTLMHDSDSIFDLTHVIVDEIHERDKFSDFLLIVLKEGLQRNPNLKIILMSATLKTQIFESYFEDAVTCNIPGRIFPIQELFLEDILRLIGYESDAMSHMRRTREVGNNNAKMNSNHVNADLENDMDDAINMCINYGNDECFDQLLQLIISEDANVNHQQSDTLCTGLMAAAMHGNYDVVEKLVFMGADIYMTCAKGKTACEWAEYYNKFHVVNLLREINTQKQSGPVPNRNRHPSEQLLADYDKTITDEQIDFNLVISIIRHIHNSQQPGSILVFLPGYDDILQCHEFLSSEPRVNDFAIFLLHGSMQIGAQHSVFNVIPGKRKIILSTNVAETSITIDDVVYVIDTGKAKEKTFDAISCIGALQTTWISKACARQRAGRAGRTREGMCFHIYSRDRFESMQSNRTPEILRVSLHELCLHTKKLAPEGMAIAAFLAQAIEPPSSISVQSAVQSLQALGALDEDENLTSLGEHLLQISAEPHLAKMLIYSTILKCIDPVLTIVSCLAHKDPFVLPAQGKLKAQAQAKRKSLCFEALSDHMSFIRAFQMWQEAKMKNMEKKFCREYYVSSATMEMILQTRVQLLSQLRAAGFVQPSPPDNIQSLNKFAESWPVIKAVLIVGLYPNLAYVQNKKITTRTEKRVGIHTSSCLSRYLDDSKRHPFHNWVVFEELSKTGQFCSIKCATIIAPIVVSLMCGKATLSESDGFSINIDDWLEFEPSNHDLFQFRLKLEETINKKVSYPTSHLNGFENGVVDSLYEILSAEDAVVHLRHPEGVGMPPRFVSERENTLSCRSDRNGYGGRKYSHQNGFVRGHGQDYKFNTQYFNNVLKVGGPGVGGSSGMEAGPPGIPLSNGDARRPRRHQGNRFFGIRYFKVGPAERALSDGAQFYVIKPNRTENIDISIQQRKWMFSPPTERKVIRAFNDGKEVILFYTVHSTGCFQGIARLLGTNNGQCVPCPVQWLCRIDLRHQDTHNFLNPYNNYRRIFYCEDGQMIEPEVGRRLYNMFFEAQVPEQNIGHVRPILGGAGN